MNKIQYSTLGMIVLQGSALIRQKNLSVSVRVKINILWAKPVVCPVQAQ